MIFLLIDISEVRESDSAREYRTANLSVIVREAERSVSIVPHSEEKSRHTMDLKFSSEPEKTKTAYIYKVSDSKGLLMKITIFNPISSKTYLDFEILPENGGIYAGKFEHQATLDETW